MTTERWTDERLDQLTDAVANDRADIRILIEDQRRLKIIQTDLAETQGQLAQRPITKNSNRSTIST